MTQFGPIRAYYADLTSGEIRPEDVRIESLPYRVEINALGEILTNTDAVSIISRYNFVLRKIYAWGMNPADLGFAPGLTRFNAREQGRSMDIFKMPQFIASYLGTSGPCTPHEWDGCWITVPGTQLEVNWTIDSLVWPAMVGAYRMFGVDLVGDYVNCGQPRAPAGG